MIRADGLEAATDTEELFRAISFVLHSGDRLGVVGPNGAGKSTLLAILAGHRQPEAGVIETAPGDTIGYLPQRSYDPSTTVRTYIRCNSGTVGEAAIDLERAQEQLGRGSDEERRAALNVYAEAEARFNVLGGWKLESRIDRTRDDLDIRDIELDKPLSQLSGGEQARVMLSAALLELPTILLLDEPSNHLDRAGRRWLAAFFRGYAGTLIVASHDRELLRGTTQILELDGIHVEPQWYQGTYDDYEEEKARRWERLVLDHKAQERYRKQLEEDIRRAKWQARMTESSTMNDHYRRLAKKVARKATARERRLERQMALATWVAKPETRRQLAVDVSAVSEPGRLLLRADDARPVGDLASALSPFSLEVRGRDRIAVRGPNGSGKSTLLAALAGTLEVEPPVERAAMTAFVPQYADRVTGDRTVLEEFRRSLTMYEDDAIEYLMTFLFDYDDLVKPATLLSSGELTRLALANAIASQSELLLLDEPTNHLDIPSIEAVELALGRLQATMVVVSHDEYFLRKLACNRCIEVVDGVVREVFD